ncbi:MAG: ribosome maturation factor RimP [Rhizobiales bacterium]|nr:ribosome maturation factor RimP [Hyphomicrobiales bacterium]MBA67831.1 ribosome maturation factor RimP [Hyphomicrobiales bacterium]
MDTDSQLADNQTDERIITETGLDARIAQIVEPVIVSMDYRLVRVRMSGQNGLTLQIMAERPDGTMTVTDCEAISRGLSPVLDVEDPIGKQYHLEVSSPGIDRPMVRVSDFKRWQGHLARCDTSQLVDNRKRHRGFIRDVTDAGFSIERDQPVEGEENVTVIPFSALAEAKLILTDDLIRDALKADKAAKQARKAAGEEIDDEFGDDVEIESANDTGDDDS